MYTELNVSVAPHHFRFDMKFSEKETGLFGSLGSAASLPRRLKRGINTTRGEWQGDCIWQSVATSLFRSFRRPCLAFGQHEHKLLQESRTSSWKIPVRAVRERSPFGIAQKSQKRDRPPCHEEQGGRHRTAPIKGGGVGCDAVQISEFP